jgi:phage gpG-like protein
MIGVEFDAQAVQDALLCQADALRGALEARIQQKLSGDVLQTRSGALAASIVSSIENDGSDTSVSISSTGVPYAAIQEFGGKTAAHDIVAVKAKALAFSMGGEQIFAKSVHHPGSTIPARSYLGSSLAEMSDEIESGFKQAILEALGQG